MPKFVMMPPLDEQRREWARRLADTLPEYEVVVPETDAAARWELAEADAAFGWIPPEALKKAHRLRWLQNPDAGPFAGYFYPDLIDHPVIVCNPRGIYFDHISHHVMMFVLALSRGLPYYADAQRERRWDKEARKSHYVNLPDSTVLIVGVVGSDMKRRDFATSLAWRCSASIPGQNTPCHSWSYTGRVTSTRFFRGRTS